MRFSNHAASGLLVRDFPAFGAVTFFVVLAMASPCNRTEFASYIGIDPGTSGAVAVIHGDRLALFPIPIAETKRNGKIRKRLDVAALCTLAHSLFVTLGGGRVLVEDVWIAGGDNPASAGELIRIASACETAFTAAGFDVETVAPQTWKAAFGIAGAGLIEPDRSKRRSILKTRARETAMRTFAAYEKEFSRVKDADRAEAALIAEFGRRSCG